MRYDGREKKNRGRKIEKIELELKLLERIAKYYEFPLTVFLTNGKLLKKTRCKYLEKEIKKKFGQIKKLIDEII